MRLRTAFIVYTAGLALLPCKSQANQIIYNNVAGGVPVSGGSFATLSADDFTLANSAGFNSVTVWAIKGWNSQSDPVFVTPRTFDWWIFASLPGYPPNVTPGGVLFSGAGASSEIGGTPVYVDGPNATQPGYTVQVLDISLPDISLPAGRYWLGLASEPGSDNLAWAAVQEDSYKGTEARGGAVRPDGSTQFTIDLNADLAFQLCEAPEPGSLSLLFLGILGLSSWAGYRPFRLNHRFRCPR